MSITTTPGTGASLLSDEMLARFDERAPVYDRENRFFDEDFAELREVRLPVWPMPDRVRRQRARPRRLLPAEMRRLGYVAPATALAVNMHVYWTGRRRRPRCGPATSRAGGSSRRPPTARCSPRCTARPATTCRCCCRARRPSGPTAAGRSPGTRSSAACRRCGPTADSTPWTRRIPQHPQIVHGFLPRDAEGYQIIDTWDTLGMRATQSQDTVLDKAFVPDELVPLVCPAGFAGAGLFHVAIFAWALMGFASVYLGAARRAFDMTVERMPQRTSVALTRLDGPPPRGAAPRGRHADGLRRRRGAARAHDRRLDERRRARRLAGAPRQHAPDR